MPTDGRIKLINYNINEILRIFIINIYKLTN
jgi:hypothetical protein